MKWAKKNTNFEASQFHHIFMKIWRESWTYLLSSLSEPWLIHFSSHCYEIVMKLWTINFEHITFSCKIYHKFIILYFFGENANTYRYGISQHCPKNVMETWWKCENWRGNWQQLKLIFYLFWILFFCCPQNIK